MFDSRMARTARWMMLGGLLAPMLAAAQLRPVTPGQAPELKPDEALLVVAVDSDTPLAGARLRHGDDFADLGKMPAGTHYTLFVAPAGRYAWRDVMQADDTLRPLALDDFSFDLSAGDLREIEEAASKITLQGARLPESVLKMTGL